MKKLKLGYAPTRRFVFSAENAFKYKVQIREKMESFGLPINIVDLEGLNSEGLLHDDLINAHEIIKRFKEEKVDAVFFPHCNFGTEDTVARVAQALGKPVLLWGPRDEARLKMGCGFVIHSVVCLQQVRYFEDLMCRLRILPTVEWMIRCLNVDLRTSLPLRM